MLGELTNKCSVNWNTLSSDIGALSEVRDTCWRAAGGRSDYWNCTVFYCPFKRIDCGNGKKYSMFLCQFVFYFLKQVDRCRKYDSTVHLYIFINFV